MVEIKGDIWRYHPEFPICITTNGVINSRGECVMGRGIALQAKTKYPEFPLYVADHIAVHGNVVGYFKKYNLFTFPTKHRWFENSNLDVIGRSAKDLIEAVDYFNFSTVYLVPPGIGNGKLNWSEVKPVIQDILDDRIVIVNYD